MVFDYIIIGAGASGVTAAISLAEKNKKVLLIEHKDRILKKLLVTGNGRCNFTNINAKSSNYYSENSNLVNELFSKYTSEDIIKFFEKIGILSVVLENGKVYPKSLQASSVVDMLKIYLEHKNVEVKLDFKIDKIVKKDNLFHIKDFKSKKLVIATGGNSYKQLGSDGSGYELAKKFGHSITELRPVLVQLKTEKEYVKGLEGIKQEVVLTCKIKDKVLREDKGELLFTSYGVSGPVIFNQSVLTAKYGFSLDFYIDFLPEYNYKELFDILKERKEKLAYLELTDYLNAIVNKKLGMFLLKKSGIDKLNKSVNSIDDKILNELVKNLKEYKFKAYDTSGFAQAQVTAGGVNTKEINEKTLESKLVKNLYFCGEILDVYGDCGGYNLQFAFASGLLIGDSYDKN